MIGVILLCVSLFVPADTMWDEVTGDTTILPAQMRDFKVRVIDCSSGFTGSAICEPGVFISGVSGRRSYALAFIAPSESYFMPVKEVYLRIDNEVYTVSDEESSMKETVMLCAVNLTTEGLFRQVMEARSLKAKIYIYGDEYISIDVTPKLEKIKEFFRQYEKGGAR